jgi:hypothetical protein
VRISHFASLHGFTRRLSKGIIMRLDYILKAAAKRMQGVTVDCDNKLSTVCISSDGEDDIFMQGDDAVQFIHECELYKHGCKQLDYYIIMLAVAEPYAKSIWN